MKRVLPALAVLALAGCAAAAAPRASGGSTAGEPVRHVVVFKYREGADPAKIQQVTDAFRALQGRIPGILSFEHGINDSPEGKDLGFTHVYLLTFVDAAARDAYLPHPEHRAFGTMLRGLGILDDVFVVDYVPQG